MGLLDKAKGLVEGHKDQIQAGLDKAKQTVNKASDSVNQSASRRLPNTGTMTPVEQSAPAGESVPPDEVESDPMASTDEAISVPSPTEAADPGAIP